MILDHHSIDYERLIKDLKPVNNTYAPLDLAKILDIHSKYLLESGSPELAYFNKVSGILKDLGYIYGFKKFTITAPSGIEYEYMFTQEP